MLQKTHRQTFINLSLAALLAVAVLIQCIGAWQDSQTTDEAVHLSAGVIYWRTGYFLLNPEHPPLAKLLAAMPLLPFHWLNIPTHFDPSVETNEWIVGATMLYRSATNLESAKWIMFLGRLPMIGLWAVLGGLIWIWSKRLWGTLGAALSLGLYAFDPTWLGHGHLVTTDVASALGFTLTFYTMWRLLEEPSKRHWWWFALAFGFAQVTKFSMLLLWLIVPLMSLIVLLRRDYQFPARSHLKIFGIAVLSSMVIAWLIYGLNITRPNADPRIQRLWVERDQVATGQVTDVPPFVQTLVRVSDPATQTGKFLASVANAPIPGYSYWRGVFSLMSHNYYGHAAFLFGQFSYAGWWWYFPIAFLLKTPFLTLLLMTAAIVGWLWRWKKLKRVFAASLFVVVPAVVYMAWSMTSHINIGLRHVLPIYPFIFIGIGGLVLLWRDRWKTWFVFSVLLLSAAVTIRAYPNTIGYFNFMAGGTDGGHRYLLDSNLDWNQDIWRLRNWLDTKKIGDYRLSLFGSIPASIIFPEAKPMLTDQDVEAGLRPSGWLIISAGQLFNIPGPFHWLQTKTPTLRIGSSIYVFHVIDPAGHL